MPTFLAQADDATYPIEIIGGEGCWLIAKDKKRYLDFVGGWCVSTVGWKRPELTKAIQAAADFGTYIPPVLHWQGWEDFARLLCTHAPGKLQRAYRCTSGSEAVEFGLKLARAASGKKTIVSFADVYQGHTYGAASVGRALRPGMAPGVPKMLKIPLPDEYRNPWKMEGSALTDKVLEEFEKIVTQQEVAAFVSEAIFSNAGVIIPPADLYPRLAEFCRAHDILLMIDEVATGFGRTGKLFASEHWNIAPDILCLGKALTGGYATMGATLVTEEVFQHGQDIPRYSTFGWLPIDLFAAAENVRLVLDEKLAERSQDMGALLLAQLKSLEQLPYVGRVRGQGLLIGIEIVKDKLEHARDAERAEALQAACLKRGVFVEVALPGTLFLSPPLVISKEELRQGAEMIRQAVEAVT